MLPLPDSSAGILISAIRLESTLDNVSGKATHFFDDLVSANS